MKKIILAFVVGACLMACGNTSKQQNEATNTEQTTVASDVLSLDEMLQKAEELKNKEITVKGYVTHTCSHSGKRCFLQGDSKVTIRVEAKGEIGGFNRELIGNEIAVTGILKEKQLTEAEINLMEKDIEAKAIKDDGSEESCDTERANIEEMRAWMKANNKDYFAIYYLDGLTYDEL